MKSEPRLRIEFLTGGPIDEYRIAHDQVEFRALDSDGNELPAGRSEWRQLSADEISMHLAWQTVVAEWLNWRLARVARAA